VRVLGFSKFGRRHGVIFQASPTALTIGCVKGGEAIGTDNLPWVDPQGSARALNIAATVLGL
jgi:hypothetical protein